MKAGEGGRAFGSISSKEIAVAFKEQNGGEEPDAERIAAMIKDVVEVINDKMPAYKRITIIEVVREPFEKTSTKKIKRFGTNVE